MIIDTPRPSPVSSPRSTRSSGLLDQLPARLAFFAGVVVTVGVLCTVGFIVLASVLF